MSAKYKDPEKIEWLKEEAKFIENLGEIRLLGWRHTLIDPRTFKHMRNRMIKIIGPATDSLLYLSAKDHTIDFVDNVMKKNAFVKIIKKFKWGKKKIAENIAKILTHYGYGVAKLEKFDPDGESILTLKNSCIGTFYKNEKKPTCSYIAGLIAGGTVVLFKKDYDCEEIECVAKGDKICKFLVKKSNH
jgi:predicted hydrocarbon binding protein